jgi:hypothetical protein
MVREREKKKERKRSRGAGGRRKSNKTLFGSILIPSEKFKPRSPLQLGERSERSSHFTCFLCDRL